MPRKRHHSDCRTAGINSDHNRPTFIDYGAQS